MTRENNQADWWSTADVNELTGLLAGRMRSRLWQHTEPGELAAWVFDPPEPASLLSAPALLDGHWRDGLDERQQLSWALAGWVLRTAVPEVRATAGTHWLLSHVREAGLRRLRLTVGPVAFLRLNEHGDEVRLRLALAPLHAALQAGALSDEEWEDRGIALPEDTTRTYEEEKILVRCPDVETTLWLLKQSPVMVAARMLAARLSTMGFPFHEDYRPEVAARAWVAAEDLLTREVTAPAAGRGPLGFDRPYRASAVAAALPTQRSFDADAYRAGVSEHDRLCRAVIDHLEKGGTQVGTGLHAVPVDLAWRTDNGRQVIAEVKSVLDGNEIEQLRLGLGQILEYRHRLAALNVPVTAVLVVSRLPDPIWRGICADSRVTLVAMDCPSWPVEMAAVAAAAQ
ncbi:hypothetical protein SAMN05216284_104109 [Micromonospora sediminimaris]|uniref:Uncharacterized protein n=2 Tax=Micromonospora sediminimaris TaxID=547162 RepID=A0A9W5XHV1_9ACTN|nr:hypothetical protein Vse01_06840 [Micromonospora sediminimaris]SFC37122.1 hypothetical protein SAMN05216284_104109 [Micromonospora sediminimaris]